MQMNFIELIAHPSKNGESVFILDDSPVFFQTPVLATDSHGLLEELEPL